MIVIGFIATLYFLWIIFILINWIQLPSVKTGTLSGVKISILIPVRNEESNIGALLEDINCQNLTTGQLTVWVLDDGSSDRTAEIVKEIAGKVNYSLKYVFGPDDAPDERGGKKSMITLGVRLTGDPVIIQTDADCRVGPGWVESLIAPFHDNKVQLVTGPVAYTGKNHLIGHMLGQELSALLVTTAAMIRIKKPVMCNGACMAYRRDAFLQAGGYQENEGIASGDDSFLMHSIDKKYPGSVQFLKNKNAMVRTPEPEGFKEFLNQRIRWAGKWNAGDHGWTWWLAIFIFLTNLNFLWLAAFSVLSGSYGLFLVLFAGKLLLEYLLLLSWSRYFLIRLNLPAFLIAGILYPFYTVIFGVLANTSKFTWKGRNYRQP